MAPGHPKPYVHRPLTSPHCPAPKKWKLELQLTTLSRPSRTPLVIAAFGGAAAIFVGLKWRAVFARSEAAKERSGANVYTVQTGRSGGGI